MKILRTGKEARNSLRRGIDTVANCVGKTLGPSGRNAIIGRKFLTPLITNDGVSVAKAIVLEDEIEQLGAQTITEVSSTTDDNVGDGTTTATVLAQAIMAEGFSRLEDEGSFVKNNVDPILIRKEIDVSCEKVVARLKEMAVPISTPEEIEKVAFVSVEDREIAKTIAGLFTKIGKDGVVTITDGYFGVESEVVEGIELKSGYSSNYLANGDKGLTLNNIHVLVTNIKIDSNQQLLPLTNKLAQDKINTLVVIADHFSKEMLADCVMSKVKNQFILLAIKSPYFGNKERLEDLATKFGTIFVDEDQRMTIEGVSIDQLGKVSSVFSNKDKTLFIGGKGDVSKRVELLKEESTKKVSPFDKKQLDERIATLNGGIGIIKVGAQSPSEREYLKLKIQDCVGATKAALQEGVVRGGGLALKQISEELGDNILTKALKVPYELIQSNAGVPFEVGEDIIDPVKVTRTALMNACSVAGMILTTEICIADKIEEENNNK